MPVRVDHDERRRTIAGALWELARARGLERVSLRDVAAGAGMSLGQLQHYFATREDLVGYAMDLVSQRTAARIKTRIAALGADPHPRDVLRALTREMLVAEDPAGGPVGSAQLSAALRSPQTRERTRDEMLAAHAAVEAVLRQAVESGAARAGLDPRIEAARLLALTGFAPLLELGVYTPEEARAALDRHLEQLFAWDRP